MRLRKDVTAQLAISQLEEQITRLSNLRATTSVNSLVAWAADAEAQLRRLFLEPDLAAGIYTPRFWQLFNWVSTGIAEGGDNLSTRHFRLLSAEIDAQLEILTEELDLLRQLRTWASEVSGETVAIVVYDTNTLIHYYPPDAIAWADVTGASRTRLVVPLTVMDELDRKRYGVSTLTSRRAKSSQRRLLELLSDSPPGVRVAIKCPGEGQVTVEVLMDEPGHVRLPDPDEEIVARAALTQQLAGTVQVRVLTHDGGMQLRAKGAGLHVMTLGETYSKDQSPEPVSAILATEAERAGQMSERLLALGDQITSESLADPTGHELPGAEIP